MRPTLLLVDLQQDFLRAESLTPAAGQILERAAALLRSCRELGVPVIHVWTSVDPHDDRRMPHWKAAARWACVVGSEGHAPPAELAPTEAEAVVHKTFYSGFDDPQLEARLAASGCDTVLVAGLYLHGCVRATVLDAYRRGLTVYVAEDAVGSDDPLHAAITRRYLEGRAATFASEGQILGLLGAPQRHGVACPGEVRDLPAASVEFAPVAGAGLPGLVHVSPREGDTTAFRVPICGSEEVAGAVAATREASRHWRHCDPELRAHVLRRFADKLASREDALAQQMAVEIGKPITQARGEIRRSAELVRVALRIGAEEGWRGCGTGAHCRYRPLGVVAAVTPWNNPLAIAVGKFAPALVYGNAVVWKPAPAGSGLAHSVMELLDQAGVLPSAVNLVCGDRRTAASLMAHPEVAAVTITGGVDAGYAAQDICSRRHVPLQAELGGNNAAIVWADCDLEAAARQIAEGAFGFAGQRCTANRRAIVDDRCYVGFVAALEAATAALVSGDPLDPRTQIGPLVSAAERDRVAAVVARASQMGGAVLTPQGTPVTALGDAYHPPTIVCCDEPEHEIVQEETFGPVLVVQRASDWEHALALCNGVRQGLAAALFSESLERQDSFLAEAEAGILKLNTATADAGAEAPFGGWKASGIGPPEHGASAREFFTRTQAIYGFGT